MSDPRFDYDRDRLNPDPGSFSASGALTVIAIVVLLIGSLIYFAGDRPQTADRAPTQMVERTAPAPLPPAPPRQ